MCERERGEGEFFFKFLNMDFSFPILTTFPTPSIYSQKINKNQDLDQIILPTQKKNLDSKCDHQSQKVMIIWRIPKQN